MKTLIWVVGIPGSGKTTVAKWLENLTEGKLFSYGKLLKQAQPQSESGEYTQEDCEKANQILIDDSFICHNIIIDGNPYSKSGFDLLSRITSHFDEVKIVLLLVTDEVALARLEERSFPIQDEVEQNERIDNFNSNLLPLITDYWKEHKIFQIDTEAFPPKLIASKILSAI